MYVYLFKLQYIHFKYNVFDRKHCIYIYVCIVILVYVTLMCVFRSNGHDISRGNKSPLT